METIDTTVLDGRVTLKQPQGGGLRVTMDTIFVAAACPARSGETIADFGAGTGGAGLCVAVRVGGVHVSFVEIQPDFMRLSLDNAALNGIEADGFAEDVRTHKGQYDHIVCNPPYLDEGTHYASPDPVRQKALGQVTGDAALADWVAAAARCLKDKGSLSLIHRADALDAVLSALGAHKFGAVEIWPLQPFPGQDAHRIVVRARLRRRTKLILHPMIPIHEVHETYMPQALAILNGEIILT